MKKFIITSILLALFTTTATLTAQNTQPDYLGLPGDNLNLYAVMNLFQDSKTLEDFERSLNDPQTNINNLDLNGDNQIDYIKVFDDVDGNVHNIVLQVAVSPKENQDIAVFTVQRFQNGQVQIQLTGDEELYGKNYIIEPNFDETAAGGTPNPGYTGNTRVINGQTVVYVRTTPLEIAAWPCVRFMFLPTYSAWHSSWSWGYYPSYWHTWHPYSWNYYYGFHRNMYYDYYGRYRRTDYHRYTRWNDYYYAGRRSYSPDVNHRIHEGYYKNTYSHPEQRQEGENFFAKTHPEQYKKATALSTGSKSTTYRRPTTNVSNKPATSMSKRPVTNQSSGGNNSGANRRNPNNVTNRSANPNTNKNVVTTHKSTTTVTRSSNTNASSERSNAAVRKPANTVTNKPANNPSGQNNGVRRASGQQKTNVVSSSSKSNVKKTKSATSVKKDDRSKDSDNKDSNHR